MSHWTVEQGPVLVWDDRVLPIPLTWPDGEAAYDALVECVRKADKHDRQKHSKPEPREVFAQLDERFRFTLDVAASLRIEFLRGRLRFLMNGDDRIRPNQRPPFGCCLVIWEAS